MGIKAELYDAIKKEQFQIHFGLMGIGGFWGYIQIINGFKSTSV